MYYDILPFFSIIVQSPEFIKNNERRRPHAPATDQHTRATGARERHENRSLVVRQSRNRLWVFGAAASRQHEKRAIAD